MIILKKFALAVHQGFLGTNPANRFKPRLMHTFRRVKLNELSSYIHKDASRKRRMEQAFLNPYLPEDKRQAICNSRNAALLRRRQRLYVPLLPSGWPAIALPPDGTNIHELPACILLARLNSHHRDRDVVFYSDTHTYLINGERSMGSVTGLIKSYIVPFNAAQIIDGMRHGRSWPRAAYLRTTIPNAVM